MTYIISIIGRPNVGKSTLFNRLIKSKKAIIDPTPGVTRDIISGSFILNNELCIKLQDTGGLTDEGDILNTLIQDKTLTALKNSDLILFLVESKKIIPIEEEYIKIARKTGKDIILCVNKCDSIERDNTIFDFYEYGIEDIIPISAAHNRNIEELLDKIYYYLKKLPQQSELKIDDGIPPFTTSTLSPKKDNLIKLAIVGKPNVGKSSLLNKIVSKDRSIVSEIAGTTRDVVDEYFTFGEKEFLILDTAGIRRKSKVNEDIEYYSVNRAIKAIEESDVVVLVIDSLEELSTQDKKITDQIVNNRKALIIALNKWDLQEIGDGKKENNYDIFTQKKDRLLFLFPQIEFAPIVKISALNGKGIVNLIKKVIKVYDNINKKIETSKLNKFIGDIVKKRSPTTKSGNVNIYYGIQNGIAPVEFIFFINNTKNLSESYRQYVINRLREEFDFSGVPIKVTFRNKN